MLYCNRKAVRFFVSSTGGDEYKAFSRLLKIYRLWTSEPFGGNTENGKIYENIGGRNPVHIQTLEKLVSENYLLHFPMFVYLVKRT